MKILISSSRGSNYEVEYPFWSLLNGPIADMIWHVGQVVTFRRSLGNPFNGNTECPYRQRKRQITNYKMTASSLLRNKTFKVILLSLIGLYIFSLIFFYLFRNQLVFQGTALTSGHHFQFDQPFKENFVTLKDGSVLNGLFFKSSTPSKGLVFYLHGNAANLHEVSKSH